MVAFIVKCRKVIVTDVEIEANTEDEVRAIVSPDIDGHMSKFEPTTVAHLISAVYRRDAEYDYSGNKNRKDNPNYKWKKSKSLPKRAYAGKAA